MFSLIFITKSMCRDVNLGWNTSVVEVPCLRQSKSIVFEKGFPVSLQVTDLQHSEVLHFTVFSSCSMKLTRCHWSHSTVKNLQATDLRAQWRIYRSLISLYSEESTGHWSPSTVRNLDVTDLPVQWRIYRSLISEHSEEFTGHWSHSTVRNLDVTDLPVQWRIYRSLISEHSEESTGHWSPSTVKNLQVTDLTA